MAAVAIWDTPAFFAAVVELVRQLPGLSEVHEGVPSTVTERVSAYVTVGGQEPDRKAANGPRGGLFIRWSDCMVVFAYRITDVATVALAEREIARLLDAVTVAVFTDPTLGGVVEDIAMNLELAREPEYQMRAGQHEFREFPVLIRGKQSKVFGAA